MEAIILTGQLTNFGNIYGYLFYLIPIQYTLRAYNLYRWLDRHAKIKTAVKRFLKSTLDFLPFILTAHLFGALWYYFAVDRKIVCWKEHTCDFGIYLYAFQSNMTSSRNLPVKMLQCIWWGLRNLSSFGSNLQTSFFRDEIIFSIVISISGLALFLVYLNSRVQGSKKVSDHLKLQQKIETIYADIIEKMRKMCCLASLKKVSLLESTDDKVLQAICQYLKPVTYGEDVYIIREGEPLRKMLFITGGTALTYTPIKGGTNVCKCLEKSDFYGEELLNWAFKSCVFSELPISTTTLMSQTKVEAFSIRANNLKSIVAQFWFDYRMELPRSQLEHFAASYIQALWRRRCAKAKVACSEGASSFSIGALCNFFHAGILTPHRAKAKGRTGWDKLTLN
ncbi:cyclic nucleotide-gated ion channel 1-like [Prunus avium]|uniref:Cyclic nucleotide-gated ion channel 1-like n=1 Tax=Prunus avium TaxID=42229 RepID=A0A6P5RZJ9_PRUAV|nr:cyclic nucleotide-gated ion channel 1-like [Prunus avium]